MNNTALTSLTLTNTFVFVDDPDKALTFYRDVLGLTVNTDVTEAHGPQLRIRDTPPPPAGKDQA